MAVFIAITRTKTTDLAKAVQSAFADDHLRYSDSIWFIKGNGLTAKKVVEKLGVEPGKLTGVVVFRLAGSFDGLSNREVWDWIGAAFEPSNG
jgi:hypothetical protein